MAVDVTLNNISSGYNLDRINENFDLIDAALQDALSLSGQTPNSMTADLDMNSNKLINLLNPTLNQDAATKKYVDNIITGSGTTPEPLPADDNKVLKVDGVTYSWEQQISDDVSYDNTISGLVSTAVKQAIDELSGITDVLSVSDGIAFTNSGTGAVTRTVESKLRETVSPADFTTEGNFDTARGTLTGRIDHVIRAEGMPTDRLLSDKLSDVISVKDFGAVGDGSTDDTVAIQAAIDFAEIFAEGSGESQAVRNSFNCCTIYFPPGQYSVTSTLTINGPGVHLRGAGMVGTIILMTANSKLFDIRHDDQADNGNLNNIAISDMYLRGTYVDPTETSIAIKLGVVKHWYLYNLRISGFYDDIQLEGVQEPGFISNCNFFSGPAVTGSTGTGGGTFINITSAIVNLGSQNDTYGVVDPDIADTYYASNAMVYVTGCEFRNSGDAKKYGFNIESIDGLYVTNCHLVGLNNINVRINQKSAISPISNVRFSNTFFDGKEATTEFILEVPDAVFATTTDVFNMKVDFNACKFNGVSNRLVRLKSPFFTRLNFDGCFFDKCTGSNFIEANKGGETLIIQNCEFSTSNAFSPTNIIILGSGGSVVAADFWRKVVISSNTFWHEFNATPDEADYIIRITNEVGSVVLMNNAYEAGDGVSGDGFVFDNKSVGSVTGSAAVGNNIVFP